MNIIEQLKRHEGLRLKPYKCTGDKLTIGYGRNLEAKGITEVEANFMLAEDVAFYSEELSNKLSYFDNLSEARQAVLINMAFNLGVNGLMKFKKTLSYVSNQYYDQAAVEMLNSRWAKQVGKRSIELSEQMKTGQFCY